MELFTHKNRNVVVKREDSAPEGKALVSFVSVAESVVGSARRGRKPNYSKPVALSELTAVESPSEELLAMATKALAGFASAEDSDDAAE